MKYYTVKVKNYRGSTYSIHKCIKIGESYLRPVAYLNGHDEREPVLDPGEEIGYEYEILTPEKSGLEFVSAEEEKE